MAYDLQKANMLKRVSAYIFDFILLVTLAVGIAALLSGMVGYDDHTAKRQVLRAEYEAQWGVSFDIPQEDYAKLTEEQRALYDEAYAAFATDTEVNELDMKIINGNAGPCLGIGFVIRFFKRVIYNFCGGKRIPKGFAAYHADGEHFLTSSFFWTNLYKYSL